jgi:hypothetical protein
LCETHLFQIELAPGALGYAEEVAQVAPRGSAPWGQGMLLRLVCAFGAGQVDHLLGIIRELCEVETSAEGAVALALALVVSAHLLDTMGVTVGGLEKPRKSAPAARADAGH